MANFQFETLVRRRRVEWSLFFWTVLPWDFVSLTMIPGSGFHPATSAGDSRYSIVSRIAWNHPCEAASTALWKNICRGWRPTFAPILIHLSGNSCFLTAPIGFTNFRCLNIYEGLCSRVFIVCSLHWHVKRIRGIRVNLRFLSTPDEPKIEEATTEKGCHYKRR